MYVSQLIFWHCSQVIQGMIFQVLLQISFDGFPNLIYPIESYRVAFAPQNTRRLRKMWHSGCFTLWFVVDIITFMVLLPVLIENLYATFLRPNSDSPRKVLFWQIFSSKLHASHFTYCIITLQKRNLFITKMFPDLNWSYVHFTADHQHNLHVLQHWGKMYTGYKGCLKKNEH
jgi:hypothetical protein